MDYRFPDGFAWGTATAAFQIEGAPRTDGKGASIWDAFTARNGTIERGETAAIACDHYNRYRDDIALMARLGYQAYRFSVSWPRVFPTGRGEVNDPGLDFYDRLVDECLTHDIDPFLTLYHWDLPQKLSDDGGWYNRDTAHAFGEYAATVAARLGDRVRYWITINEPWIVTVLGHMIGTHAPGRRTPYRALRVAHNLLLAHGLGVQGIRSAVAGVQKPEGGVRVGIVNNLSSIHDVDLRRTHPYARRAHEVYNELWMDPIFLGRYPPSLERGVARQNARSISPNDLTTIAEPIDFLGINTYNRTVVRRAMRPLYTFNPVVPRYDGAEYTEMGWEVYPQGLYEIVRWVQQRYGNPPIYITENGMANPTDPVTPPEEGTINDARRISYIRRHLVALHNAIAEGADVRGYFVWSFMDNFEWAHGYRPRFGLVHVDYSSPELTRTPKESAHWYGKVVRNNGL